ncbi:MAG: hypothetical protein JSR77_09560 [Planctomycetes bacterium]|nr:hypothetical protein [Planctomycetota bacterium]
MKHCDPAFRDSSPDIRIPKYRHHKASGQAVVTLAGKDVYLGVYGSKASKSAYQRHIGEFMTRGGVAATGKPNESLTVADLILRYWKYAGTAYNLRTRKGMLKPVLRRWRKAYLQGVRRRRRSGPDRRRFIRGRGCSFALFVADDKADVTYRKLLAAPSSQVIA